MKRMGTVRKLAVAVAVCMAVLCLPGYSEPTPEQIEALTFLLMKDTEDGNLERVKARIEAGADINANAGEGTALMCAAFGGHQNILELLIRLGADVNAKTEYGETALMYGAKNGKRDTVELLIKSGANINAKDDDGETALIYAIKSSSDIDTIDLLIKSGADVNAQDKDGRSASYWAKSKYVKMLLRAAGATK